MKRVVLYFTLFCFPIFGFAQSIDFSFSQTCLGEQTTFVGSSSLADPSIAEWNWDFDNDGQFDDGSGKTVVNLFQSEGAKDVGLEVVPVSGPSIIEVKSVEIDPLPQVDFIAENLCEGQTAFYSSSSSISVGSIDQFHWDFDNNGSFDETGNDVSYICGPAQTYQVKLECVSDRGCEAFALKTTAVHHVPSVSFDASRTCVGDTTQFSNFSSIVQGSIALNAWQFGDGLAEDSQNDIGHVYTDEGSYSVLLLAVSNNGCRDSLEKPIVINPLPDVQLEISGIEIYPGEIIDASIIGDDIQSIKWSDGQAGNDVSMSKPGRFSAQVEFTNGCHKTLSFSIDSNAVDGIEVTSDLLTPNQDGINDVMTLNNVRGGQTCSITIVNRWNQVVFESNDYQNDWDGTDKGKELESGAYFYVIQCDGSEAVTGNINILR